MNFVMTSKRVQFRLRLYTLYQENKKVVFVSPYNQNELVSEVPCDIENPNTYLVPSDEENSRLIFIESDVLSDDERDHKGNSLYDWYSLHSHVEELYESGWKIRELF